MPQFAFAFFLATALAVTSVIVLQLPNVLAFLSMVTFGLGYLLAWALLILTFWNLVFLPSVLGAALDWRIGLGIAAVTILALLNPSVWLPDPRHDGVRILHAPQAAQGPVSAASVQLDVASLPKDIRRVEDPIAMMLLQNPALDWVRLRQEGRVSTRLFVRKNGVLYREDNDHELVADVIVERPGALVGWSESRVPQNWQSARLSPWKIDHVRGYLIHDARSSETLARNLSLKVSRADFPFWMQFTEVSVEPNSRAFAEFIRHPFAEIAHDPARRLEDDLQALALIATPDPAPTDQGGANNASFSAPAAVDAAVQELLDDPELSGLAKASTFRSLNETQRQVLAEFSHQLEQRVAIAERSELIALVHRSHLPVRSELVMELALEEPALMQALVDRYYLDLAQNAETRVLERVSRDVLAPLARAIGQDRERFREAFLASQTFQKQALIKMIFLFELEEPDALLAEVFDPFPPVSEFPKRLEPSFRESWIQEPWVEFFLETVQNGRVPDKSEDQEAADLAFRQVLTQKNVPGSVVRDFTQRWVLTRITPIHHDRHMIKLAFKKLEEIGADDLHAALRTYFQDLESTVAKSE